MPSSKDINIPLGQYEHYKGKRYEVIGVARHSETLEPLVVYKALYDAPHRAESRDNSTERDEAPDFGKDSLWVRPLKMFVEKVVVNGKKIKRFKKVNEAIIYGMK